MESMLNFIGDTPLMYVGGVWCKVELRNPTGSIKDRIAYAMIKDTDIRHKPTIIEATSGNTGVSVAFVASAMGLKSLILCPSYTSPMKIKMMKQYGAEVWTSHYSVGDIQDIYTARSIALSIQDGRPNRFVYLDQFNNYKNLEAQIEMATEIRNGLMQNFLTYTTISCTTVFNEYLAGIPHCIVAGTGTGGTLAALHHVFPLADVYQVLPKEGEQIEGIADGVETPLLNNVHYKTIRIPLDIAQATRRMLTLKYGINCGISSGANYVAATKLKKKYKIVITVFPDAGYRYD